MKRIDFENGSISGNIIHSAIPMMVAQFFNLLYNIVDRIYIARIPEIGTAALGAVGLCFPVIMIITAFSNLFGSGGAPIFSIEQGRKNKEQAAMIMNTAFFLLCVSSIILMVIGWMFSKHILVLFGASDAALSYAHPYMMIYLIGTFPSMIATGMNPFINAQGYATAGMLSVMLGAVCNLILDPLFIFVFHMGVRGAAIATVLSQVLSAVFVLYFLRFRSCYRIRLLSVNEIKKCGSCVLNIIGLGATGFIMQLTNSLVTISCNNILASTGGDLYVSVMTIISSIRQIIETPIHAMTEGSSPVISYNYGAKRPRHVKKAVITMSGIAIVYTMLTWGLILLAPELLLRIFSSDHTLTSDTVPAMKLYFSAFIFMLLQYIGQTVFKSLNKKKHAIFFSLLRKVVIVVPLTYLLPYAFHFGTDGVFLAEPVSNVIGGTICFVVMLCTIIPELNQMEHSQAANN